MEGRATFSAITLYYCKKSKNTTEMQDNVCAAYREGVVIDWMCQKWFVKFHARYFHWIMLHGWVD